MPLPYVGPGNGPAQGAPTLRAPPTATLRPPRPATQTRPPTRASIATPPRGRSRSAAAADPTDAQPHSDDDAMFDDDAADAHTGDEPPHTPATPLAPAPYADDAASLSDILRAVTSLNVRFDRSDAAMGTLRRDVVQRMDRMDAKIDEQTTEIVAVASRVSRLDTSQQDIARRLAAIEARSTTSLRTASSASSQGSRSGPAARDPYAVDKTIVRINAPQVVSAAAVRDAFAPIRRAADVSPDLATLAGPNTADRLARRYVLRCAGDPPIAAARARAILGALRDDAGAWMRITVTSPSGENIPLYASADDSLASIARKRTTKAVGRAIAAAGGPSSVSVQPCDGLVAAGWSPLAEIRPDAALGSATATWHSGPMAAAGADPAAAQAALAGDAAAAASPAPPRG